jgi:crossover junction endodeoxyribonuclease RuvC
VLGDGRLRILGIDASATSSGIVLFDPDQPTDVISWVIKPKETDFSRNMVHFDQFSKIVKGYSADVAIIESYAFHGPGKKHVLVEAGTMYRLTLYLAGIPWAELNPKVLKKYVTDNGNADKPLMAEGVYKLWRFRHDSNDVIDAYALARVYAEAALRQAGEPHGRKAMSAYQKDVIDKLDIPVPMR